MANEDKMVTFILDGKPLLEWAGPKMDELADYHRRYPHLNSEFIIKADITTCGVSFSKAALDAAAARGAKRKSYYLFSFDRVKASDLKEREAFLVPEDIRISGGPFKLRPTIIQSRLDSGSPYKVDARDGRLMLLAGNEFLADVEYNPKPPWEDTRLSSGGRCGEIAPTLAWNWVVFVTVVRVCQFWGAKEECKFCDINGNVRQQLEQGREYTLYKKADQVGEALEIIFKRSRDSALDPEVIPHQMHISGGTIAKEMDGLDDVSFYSQYVAMARERAGGRPYIIVQTVAHTKDKVRMLKEAGASVYHPNMEVWDKRLFEIICPGKARFVGWDEWIRRMIDAVDVFGEGHVQPNFVVGVEMAQPWGFHSVNEAVDSTSKGFDFLMSYGIVPRVTPWLVEPLSALANHPRVPTDYHLRIVSNWHELLKKHRLLMPDGLAPFGPGRSVYPTSAWFDFEERAI